MATNNPRRQETRSNLADYRPTFDRILFALALLGILVTVHLIIQQGRGFDRGCMGFSSPSTTEATFDCNAVVNSEAGKLLGVSNAFWGLGFYIVIAALGAAIATAAGSMLQRLKQVRAALIVAGFLYSLYLLAYQTFQIGEFCALCLGSAAVAALLFITQAIEYFNPIMRSRMAAKPVYREAPFFAGLAVLLIVLVGADMAYFKNLEEAAPVQAPVDVALASENTPYNPATCTYDPQKAPIMDYATMVDANDPMKGSPDAPVIVVEVFEPNCGHCKLFHPVMEEVAERYGDQARFYYKPVIFWHEQSSAQVFSLYAAQEQGKFFEMMGRQFELQNPSVGLSLDQLKDVAENIGMDADAMEDRIKAGMYNAAVNEDMFALRQKYQVSSVPALIINGRYVSGSGRNVECIGQLIAEAAQQQ